MQFFQSIGTILVLSQTLCVSSFLLNTNPPLLLHSSGPSNGYDANTVSYLFQKVDRMQLLMQEQNKTMEAQEKIIQQLLNFTQQSPSTVSLSNDLSILQMYVRRIMDEYHRLSNISDATDLALKMNNIVNSFKTITSSLTTQENKITQMDSEFYQFKQELKELNGTLSLGVQQAVSNIGIMQNTISENQRNVTNQISSLSTNHQNEISTLTNSLHSCESRITSLEQTVSQNQRQISSLNTQYSSNSQTLSALKTNATSMDIRIKNLEVDDGSSKFL